MIFPDKVLHFINGRTDDTAVGSFENINPHTAEVINTVVRGNADTVNAAIDAARAAQPKWAKKTPIERGQLLYSVCQKMEEHADTLAEIVATETGKIFREARGEVGGGIALGSFYSGEGQRMFGRSLPSGVAGKVSTTVRTPLGVAALVISANTPIANFCWKVFPALICGNSVVLKASEDAPYLSTYMAELFSACGLPDGCLNILHGYGEDVGQPLVESPRVDVISFTGSTKVGRIIAEAAARNLTKVSLELGGKNPLVVCDDADIDLAVQWTCLSAFSNAGQRCSSASRIIIHEKIYNDFVKRLIEATQKLKLGVDDDCDLGPVVNERQLKNILSSITTAVDNGAKILHGGARAPMDGFYLTPTILENINEDDDINTHELFGPVAQLYKVRSFNDAIVMCNNSPYGLTAAIHTTNVNKGMLFAQQARVGVAMINGGTYGSEPHMPFGGFGLSGNGTREPGTEAIDIYSDLKNICQIIQNIDD